MKEYSISIIIPVYNEEEIIYDSVISTLEAVSRFISDYEIIIVNDGSSDKSRQILDANFAIQPQIRIYHKLSNDGFGSAVKTGIELSKKQFILCVPADSPLSADVFSLFYNNLHKAEVIVSYRRRRLGYSFLMKINSWVFHKLISFIFDMHLRDYNWIHLYHRKLFDEGGIRVKSNGIFMLAETLIEAKYKGYSFYEIEVEQQQRLTGIASASNFSSIIKTILDIIDYYFSTRNYRDRL